MSELKARKKPGLVGNSITLLVNILFWIFFSLIFSVIIEWVGIYFSWWNNGPQHSKIMLSEELNYANDSVKNIFLGNDTSSYFFWIFNKFVIAAKFIFQTFSSFFIFLHSMSGDIFNTSNTEISNTVSSYFTAAFNISMVFLLRLFLVFFSLPLFLMAFLWGFVDGLVERDLRRFGAGRESSTVFDGAKSMVMPFFIAPFIIYLSFPTSINPMIMFAPSIIIQCVLYRTLFSKYKKYI
ncbi:TIGR03747 family integrating conjugative element membrane protein [Psychromonas sp. B3M02]|uniref:TIGR03747 family integrating conjugative element membrane protein n=1 Tax=Psychromonas sp. B3M02 TaxID=2267226 RepID=UPI000DEAEC81|nr:TIGR03747 family integrating conjugative element membrane protein [Psychromonas sp. B3M02]RBW47278.1 TIGR03747 family integrating conjugative element membrane protein [Psychromonas sp. B3M02]